jgi:hypothetical protein
MGPATDLDPTSQPAPAGGTCTPHRSPDYPPRHRRRRGPVRRARSHPPCLSVIAAGWLRASSPIGRDGRARALTIPVLPSRIVTSRCGASAAVRYRRRRSGPPGNSGPSGGCCLTWLSLCTEKKKSPRCRAPEKRASRASVLQDLKYARSAPEFTYLGSESAYPAWDGGWLRLPGGQVVCPQVPHGSRLWVSHQGTRIHVPHMQPQQVHPTQAMVALPSSRHFHRYWWSTFPRRPSSSTGPTTSI